MSPRKSISTGDGPDKVYTTGQVAKLCQVAPRTVAKWIDSGRLPGYKIPGSNDRRVPRCHLLRFLSDHGMPTQKVRHDGMVRVLFVASPGPLDGEIDIALREADGFAIFRAPTPFAAGLLVPDVLPGAILVDGDSLGRVDSMTLAARVRESQSGLMPALVLISGDPNARCWGYDAVLATTPGLAGLIRDLLARRPAPSGAIA